MTPQSPEISPGAPRDGGGAPSGLRQLLHDLAEEQPTLRVDPDTWRRGRRAHRRGIALTSTLTATTVALVAIGGTALVRDATPAAPDPAGAEVTLALPSRIWDVPSETDGEGRSREAVGLAQSPLGAGPMSVAFPVDEWSRSGLIGIRAQDGEYVELDLPGFSTESSAQWGDNPAALTADGDRLAYSWRESDDPTVSGVRILDLRTGDVTDHPLPSRRGVQVSGLSWSQDERYLVYNRRTVTSGTSGVSGARNIRVERLDTINGSRIIVRVRKAASLVAVQPGPSAPAVNDAGAVVVPGDGFALDRGDRPTLDLGGTVSLAWNSDGTVMALGVDRGDFGVAGRSGSASFVPTPWQQADRSDPVHVVGWAGPDTVAARSDDDRVLLLNTGMPEEHRLLLTMDSEILTPTVATDLLGQPTRDYPTPDWVERWYDRPAIWFAGVGVVALLVLGASVVRRRRAGL